MRNYCNHAAILALILFGTLLAFRADLYGAEKKGTAGKSTSERFVTIDFNNVDINVLVKFISELTGRNFVVNNRVKGKVTIISPKKISVT